MLTSKARNSIQLVPPPPPAEPARRAVRIGRILVGRRYAPGTVVRLPAQGIYYETPREQGLSADWLQAMLLRDKLPRPVVIPCSTRQRRLFGTIEFFDRAWYALGRLFGVSR